MQEINETVDGIQSCPVRRPQMKQLKSSLQDLREVFERGITLGDIAESFVSFDADGDATELKPFLENQNFDVVGVRRNGIIEGYALRRELTWGLLGDHELLFPTALVLPSTASLLRLFKIFETYPDSPQVFIDILGHVGGIITRGDLQKVPVRMWMFGVISLIEMQMLRIIRERYPGESWRGLLSNGRLDDADEIMRDRKSRNEEIDLADCLQFCDKADIMMKEEETRSVLGFPSRSQGQEFFEQLRALRDELAHAQDIISGKRPNTIELIQKAEKVLDCLEKV
jgi:hypothetical protein